MDKKLIDHISNYRIKVKSANKETAKKEAFKDLLNRLYSGEKSIERIIDKISTGAEATVLNIPRKDKIHGGRADTLYNKIIIEFENNLKITLNHAKEQLAGYLLGQFNSGEGYNFTLIASDCLTWKVFAPDVSQLSNLENLREDELVLNEITSASFILKESNEEDFYYWIDRFLFKEEKQKATLKRIEEAFGYQSNVFIDSYRHLSEHFETAREQGDIKVSYEQWNKFLSIAYGTFDGSESNFLVHTYLSIFSKMLAYAVISNDDYIDENEMLGIINGSIFNKYNIENFIDNDFFHWIGGSNSFGKLKKVFRLIAQEISSFDYSHVDEDILKGVYQELIDLDTRHSLGEYYTPDWLCERIVNEFNFKISDKVLDPACGSGSFLRATIHRFKELHPGISAEQLNNNIYGIDIHPLSVQIAKTTMLLALGKDIVKAKKPVHLNIILANTLLAPEGVKSLFGGEFILQIDKEKLWLNTQLFEDVHLFDEALEVCEELAEQTMHQETLPRDTFRRNLERRYKAGGINENISESFFQIYEKLKFVKERGRDSIWKFIVQNLYKPYFLNKKFDFVIGNPPWFTYSSIKNEEYQNQLNIIAEKYRVKPDKVANFPHLEIAAIFLSYCSSYFLKKGGQICFVLPRSFFNADHHDNTRIGKSKGFKISKLWDLTGISPLFRIPSSVLFGTQEDVLRKISSHGIEGITFKGNLPFHNCNLSIANPKILETPVTWYYIKQGKSTAFSTSKRKSTTKTNPYKSLFRQGATIVPRSFYFIELDQDTPEDWNDRILFLKTSVDIQADAKAPWKDLSFSGKMESNFLFRTALSKNVLPFAIHDPLLTTLPIIIKENDDQRKTVNLLTPKELLEFGYTAAAKWFKNIDDVWNRLKTEKNSQISSGNYLNWQNKLTEQNLNNRYLVLYNASAKDANAAVLDRLSQDLEFIVESKLYYYSTNCEREAYYLSSILNSSIPNLLMKDFQTTGLFGARDIHKRILDIYYPKFDADDQKHIALAELGKTSHCAASKILSSLPSTIKIEGIHLGKIRLDLKESLSTELYEIDKLVSRIIG